MNDHVPDSWIERPFDDTPYDDPHGFGDPDRNAELDEENNVMAPIGREIAPKTDAESELL